MQMLEGVVDAKEINMQTAWFAHALNKIFDLEKIKIISRNL